MILNGENEKINKMVIKVHLLDKILKVKKMKNQIMLQKENLIQL